MAQTSRRALGAILRIIPQTTHTAVPTSRCGDEIVVITIVTTIEAIRTETTASVTVAGSEAAVDPPLLTAITQTRFRSRLVVASISDTRNPIGRDPIPADELVTRVGTLH